MIRAWICKGPGLIGCPAYEVVMKAVDSGRVSRTCSGGMAPLHASLGSVRVYRASAMVLEVRLYSLGVTLTSWDRASGLAGKPVSLSNDYSSMVHDRGRDVGRGQTGVGLVQLAQERPGKRLLVPRPQHLRTLINRSLVSTLFRSFFS
jgi:hypothetical protein